MVDSCFYFNCNYSVEKLDKKIPLFYRELLEYFQELRSNCEDPLQREFILWNNKDINVENKSVFWKSWRDKNVLFVQDLLNNQGNYLSPQEFSNSEALAREARLRSTMGKKMW